MFKNLTQKRPNQLGEISQLDSLQIRRVHFNAQMLRAGETEIYCEHAAAPNFNVLEGLWRANNSMYSDGRFVDQNKILFAQAFGVTRLAGIFAIDGFKPLGEDLVSWRNFILTKLREIVARKLESGSKEHLHKWGIFQRHARTYIGLILGAVGERGLHEAHENKHQLFQEVWEAFGEAQKFSESKNLDLFKLYLIALKNFTPQGYDEASKKLILTPFGHTIIQRKPLRQFLNF